MSVASDHVAFFQAQWSGRFTDTCTITRSTGRGTKNPATGEYDNPPAPTSIYTGGCLWRPSGDKATLFGERQNRLEVGTVFLPSTATGIETDDTFTLTASADSDLVGVAMPLWIPEGDTYKTHVEVKATRRVPGGL